MEKKNETAAMFVGKVFLCFQFMHQINMANDLVHPELACSQVKVNIICADFFSRFVTEKRQIIVTCTNHFSITSKSGVANTEIEAIGVNA